MAEGGGRARPVAGPGRGHGGRLEAAPAAQSGAARRDDAGHHRARPKPPPGAPGGPPLGAPGGSTDRLVQLAFIEGDPRPAWDAFRAYAKAIEAGGKGKVSFAAPYVKTVVGTDTYVDQIW